MPDLSQPSIRDWLARFKTEQNTPAPQPFIQVEQQPPSVIEKENREGRVVNEKSSKDAPEPVEELWDDDIPEEVFKKALDNYLAAREKRLRLAKAKKAEFLKDQEKKEKLAATRRKTREERLALAKQKQQQFRQRQAMQKADDRKRHDESEPMDIILQVPERAIIIPETPEALENHDDIEIPDDQEMDEAIDEFLRKSTQDLVIEITEYTEQYEQRQREEREQRDRELQMEIDQYDGGFDMPVLWLDYAPLSPRMLRR